MSGDTGNSRKNELLGVFKDADDSVLVIVKVLIDDMLHLEDELARLRSLPWLLVDKRNPSFQKRTAAADLYLSAVSRYTDMVNKLTSIFRRQELEEDSPLREYMNRLKEQDDGSPQD